MRSKLIFIVSGIGLLLALISAYHRERAAQPLPPAFNPAANPYAKGIYAQGIIESAQAHGENINIYPEVAGTDHRGAGRRRRRASARAIRCCKIDDSVQRATVEQQQSQAEAARALLAELKAEPRRENLEVAAAQVDNAKATLKNAQDQLAKQERSYSIDPKSVSRDALDNARNARKDRGNESRGRREAVRPHQGRRVELRHPESGEAVHRPSKALCGGRRAARQIHDQGAGRRHRALDSGDRRQLRVPAGRLRQLHPGNGSAHRHGRAGRPSAGARLHR